MKASLFVLLTFSLIISKAKTISDQQNRLKQRFVIYMYKIIIILNLTLNAISVGIRREGNAYLDAVQRFLCGYPAKAVGLTLCRARTSGQRKKNSL